MAQKKTVITTMAFLLVVLLAVGYIALAAEMGGADDPLVTLGYLKDFEPTIKAEIDNLVKEQVSAQTKQLENRYAEILSEVNNLLANTSGTDFDNLATNETFVNAVAAAVIAQMGTVGGTGDGIASTFKRVDLEKGKTVTLAEGAMVFLRVGTATCVSPSSPGLINLTTGADLANGNNLEKNNLYTATVANGRGFKTTASSTTTVFILGAYTVS